jgi:hypothetical protein
MSQDKCTRDAHERCITRHGQQLDMQLRRGAGYTPRDPKPRIQVLDYLGSHLLFFYPETANRTLEDIDRFFETKPGVLVHRNKLAVQLHRPAEFIEADERIAAGEELKFGERGNVTEEKEEV